MPLHDSPEPSRRRWLNAAVIVVAAASVLLVLAAATLVAERQPIAARLAQDYLRKYGVASSIGIERLWIDGFTARARLGPPGDPDITVERLEVRFKPLHGWAAPQVRSIRLVRPVLKLRFDGRRLSFGSLQRLVDEALARPGQGPGPDVVIELGRAVVLTPAGTVQVRADAALPQSRLQRLQASIAPAVLAHGEGRAAIRDGALSLVIAGERLSGRLSADLDAAAWGRMRAEGLTVEGAFALPYPEGRQPGLDGALNADLRLRVRQADAGAQRLAGLDGRVRFDGASRGPMDRLSLKGAAQVSAAAAEARGGFRTARVVLKGELGNLQVRRTPAGFDGGAGRSDIAFTAASFQAGTRQAEDLQVQARSPGLTFVAGGAWSARGPLEATVRAARFSQPLAGGTLALHPVVLALKGRGAAGTDGATGAFRAAVTGQGGLSPDAAQRLAQAVPLLGTDPPNRTALVRALRAARGDAPDLGLDLAPGSTRLSLHGPLRLAAASGARLDVWPAGGADLADLSGSGAAGGADLALAGGGLPSIRMALARYRIGPSGVDAEADVHFAGDLGPWRKIELAAGGRLSSRNKRVEIAAADCARLGLGALVGQDGKASVERVSARLCPAPGVPVVSVTPAGWRLRARAEQGSAYVPLLLANLSNASGLVEAGARPGGAPAIVADIAHTEVIDAGPQARFRPLAGSGRATLAGDLWQGAFRLAEAKRNIPLGSVALRHTVSTGQGEAEVSASSLNFLPDGLQPADISPLLAALGSEVSGRGAFEGRIGWSKAGLTSSGRFTTAGLDFKSSFGRVKQAQVDVILTSLTPLVSAPAQHLSAQHVDWLIPLDEVEATYAVTASAVNVASARARMAKGQVSLDAIAFPFKPNQTLTGTVHLNDVDLGSLFTTLGLADVVSAQARIDGTLPFSSGPEGLRFYNGRVFADGPGRLSVSRRALTSAAAGAGGGAASPSTLQDLAYQALENLAFEQLEAQVDSRPGGRLGVIFHIKGRHDPPIAAPARIGILDALRGHALDKPIPLPKGTPIDLTLDTSLNFDELMQQFQALNAHSAAVQR